MTLPDSEIEAMIALAVFSQPTLLCDGCEIDQGFQTVIHGGRRRHFPDGNDVPNYLTSPQRAFEVVTKMTERGFFLRLGLRAAPDLWLAGFSRSPNDPVAGTQAVGAARAIGLAALRALGVAVPE